jgi:hypothetical protein
LLDHSIIVLHNFLQSREDDSIWRPQTKAAIDVLDEPEGKQLSESAELEAGKVWRYQIGTHLYIDRYGF